MAENVEQGPAGSFKLSGMVNVDTVAGYRDSLVEMISEVSFEEIEIDLREIEMQGSAVIALLISVLRESRFLEKEVRFSNCSVELHAIASACGLDKVLRLK
jgi:anti-anti-sigma factor